MRTLLLLVLVAFPVLAADAKPNVIVILADDLGASDLGCTGNTFHETPHCDRLAKDGLQFTTAYSACTVCSPTRAALLTGLYPARLHITDWIAGHVDAKAKLKVPDWTMHLPTETDNLAKAFKAAGYATASVGKWHLGDAEFYPEKQGFDVNIAGFNKGQPFTYFAPFKIPTLKDGPAGEMLSDALTREACAWIEANRTKPFFLYLPHYAVHTPLGGKPAVIEKYRKKAERLGVKKNAVYAALVESLDDSVGALRKKLVDLKLDGNTVVIFTSDNGGLLGGAKNPITTNPPFRAGKGSAYEGGVRVPLMVLWPGLTKPGTTTAAPAMSIDFAPTLIDLALNVKPPVELDGASWRPLIEGKPLERALYWHYPHYHPGGATPYTAMRADNWKLIEFFEDGRLELYDLKHDVGESKNLAQREPDRLKTMHDEMKAWRTRVGAQMPTPNPNSQK